MNKVNPSHLKILARVDGFILRCSRASSVPSDRSVIRHDRIKQLTVSPPGVNVIPALQLRLLSRLVGREVLKFHWFVLPTKEETQPQQGRGRRKGLFVSRKNLTQRNFSCDHIDTNLGITFFSRRFLSDLSARTL